MPLPPVSILLCSAPLCGVYTGFGIVPHVVFLVAPLGAGHMAQSGADQHKGRVPVWKGADYSGAAANLAVEAFNHIVCADARPVLRGEIRVGQGLIDTVLHLLSSLLELHRLQLNHNRFGLLTGGFLTFLSMDCLEHLGHQFHLGTGNHREYIAVKVDRATLVFGLGEDLAYGLQHAQTFIAHNEFYTIQTSAFEPLEEAHPASFVLFHSLGGTQNLTVTVPVDRNSH